jgi:hypothetical protein
MKDFLLKHWLKFAGVATGILGGWLYYFYVGCVSGTCPITSNPYKMMLYGAVMGYLLFDIFSKDTKKKKSEIVNNKNDKERE